MWDWLTADEIVMVVLLSWFIYGIGMAPRLARRFAGIKEDKGQ